MQLSVGGGRTLTSAALVASNCRKEGVWYFFLRSRLLLLRAIDARVLNYRILYLPHAQMCAQSRLSQVQRTVMSNDVFDKLYQIVVFDGESANRSYKGATFIFVS